MATIRNLPRSHLALGGLLAAGVALRVYAMAAYAPAVLTRQAHDGAGYVRAARRGFEWADQEPSGYPLFLRVVHGVSGELGFTVGVQHLLGLATGVILYLTARRLDAPRWLALVPAAAVWLNADQLFLEHAPMSEAFFTPVLALTVYAGVRCLDGGWRWPAAAGALAATLLTLRTIGLLIPVVVLGWLAIARLRLGVRLRNGLVAGLATTLVVAATYGTVREQANGHWSLVPEASGWVMYARAAEFADCGDFTPPRGTRVLCESTPPERREGPGWYLYHGGPARAAFGGPAAHDDDVRRFATAAIVHQPLDFLEVAGTDLVRYAFPSFGTRRRSDFIGAENVTFQARAPVIDPVLVAEANAYYGRVRPQRAGAAHGLERYQGIFRVSGKRLLVLLLIALAGTIAATGRVRWGTILLLAVGLELLLVPTLTHAEWRYAVPAVGPIACAAAVGARPLAARLRSLRS
jgi:hypothetical protein